ncbi:MAG TPA: nucleoside transporter C-terminal domain-containing protein [Acetobacteraceae bacterium]|jgi:CNT family concentrative nucleoside transporter|nr:nucleoside transporter C-terminal domain-containing protein [Acetobacteraceae bacterium]
MAHAALGELALLLLAWLLSEDRWRVPWRTVIAGVVLQVALALLLLDFPPAVSVVMLANRAAHALERATTAGTGFVFGYLGGGTLPFAETTPGASFILAFKALPLVLVISALASLLFHWGILQRVTGVFAWLLRRWMGISGALAVGAAVHVFVGMVEAPLLVRPYLSRMQRGELFALMTCGMAGVAGTVMVIYAEFLAKLIPNALGQILIASVISTPAGLAVAALMVPFVPITEPEGKLVLEHPPVSSIDALVKGTADGIPVLVGIVATLIVTIAMVALVNTALGLLPHWGGDALTLQRIFAWLFLPLMWLIGVPWQEAGAAGVLMGTKTVLNEFVAYLDFAQLPVNAFTPLTRLILTYALCGFANFGSAGIMVGGIGMMMPDRRAEVAQLGMRSIISGTLATCMSGAVAGAIAG